MKILQVAPYYPPYQGGQEYYVKRLVKSLKKRGHEVFVLTSNYPTENKSNTSHNIYKIPVYMRPFRNPIYKNVSHVISIIRALSKWADIIHTHNEHSMISMLTGLFVKNHHIVTTVHGKLRFGALIPDLIESTYTYTIGRYILNRSKAIIALTPDERQRLISLGINPQKIIEIPNGIDLNFVKLIDNESEKYEIDPKNHNILFIGALIIRKGIDVLIRAFDIVAKNDKKAHLYIVGNGQDAMKIVRMAENSQYRDRIHFLGRVEPDVLKYLYNIADVFVLPSRSEGLPTVIIEALAYGKKIIASDLPSVKSIFSNLVRISRLNPKDFAYAILEEIQNDNANFDMKRKFVEKYFDWEKIVDKIEKVYESILEAR